jgi:glycosyltransferase involved in cell wall biosynthesis
MQIAQIMVAGITIQISAIICTFNRASYLRKAIQSLIEQTLDPSCYEILIIDNRSTDDTKRVVTEEFSHVSNLRYIYEPIQGLSQARNTGWQNARGEYVAYLDDDAIAYPQWLEKILEVFATVNPKPGAVGGKIEPIWEAPRPSWLSEGLAQGLTILDWSETPIFLESDRWLAGANVAYPKHLLQEMKGFDVNLGRKGSNLLSCEESLLHDRLKNNGYQLYYHPAVAVRHHIHSSRLVKDWHIKRNYWNGVSISTALIYQIKPSLSVRLKKARSHFRDGILPLVKKMWLLRAQKNENEFFDLRCSLAYQLGYLYGLLRLAG